MRVNFLFKGENEIDISLDKEEINCLPKVSSIIDLMHLNVDELYNNIEPIEIPLDSDLVCLKNVDNLREQLILENNYDIYEVFIKKLIDEKELKSYIHFLDLLDTNENIKFNLVEQLAIYTSMYLKTLEQEKLDNIINELK